MKFILLTIDPPGARAFATQAAAEAAREKFIAGSPRGDSPRLAWAAEALPTDLKVTPFSAAQMAEIHNAIPGTRPVKKFENRDAMVRRMLEAIAGLEIEKARDPLVDEQPEFLKRRGGKAPARDRDDEDRITMPARKPATTAKSLRKARGGSKTELVLGLLRRKEGASAEQIMRATDWQRHSVRGFLSTLSKKPGVKLRHETGDAGRIYKAA